MYDYNKVCEVLAAAVPVTDVPNYNVEPANTFSDEFDLQQKVQYRYVLWISCNPLNESPPALSCIGCCEIDKFTGNDLLRIFHDISCRNDLNIPGKFIYFSKNRNYCAAMLFTKRFKPISITPYFEEEDEAKQRYRFLYTKLFDDLKVLQRRTNYTHPDHVYHTEESIHNLRQEAFEQFSVFLTTPVVTFPLPYFGYSFLGLLVAISYRISPKGNPRDLIPEFSLNIPFAACVQFAFARNQTGKLTKLCGEIEKQPKLTKLCGEKQKQNAQANVIRETARKIIFRFLPPNNDEMWDEVEVDAVADRVREYFSNS